MSSGNDPNLTQVELALAELGSFADELTLVGGCAAGFLITDPAAPAVRPTFDVDLVVESTGYIEYQQVGKRLEALGFQQGMVRGDPICRWRKMELVLDVMPLDESTLGFSNRWYKSAISNRQRHRLHGGLSVHHIDAPHFLATKLAAFESRGDGDVLASHDLEDVIRVVDGRSSLAGEFQRASQELRVFVIESLMAVTANRHFGEAMPSYFGSSREAHARARLVEGRLRAIIAS